MCYFIFLSVAWYVFYLNTGVVFCQYFFQKILKFFYFFFLYLFLFFIDFFSWPFFAWSFFILSSFYTNVNIFLYVNFSIQQSSNSRLFLLWLQKIYTLLKKIERSSFEPNSICLYFLNCSLSYLIQNVQSLLFLLPIILFHFGHIL